MTVQSSDMGKCMRKLRRYIQQAQEKLTLTLTLLYEESQCRLEEIEMQNDRLIDLQQRLGTAQEDTREEVLTLHNTTILINLSHI